MGKFLYDPGGVALTSGLRYSIPMVSTAFVGIYSSMGYGNLFFCFQLKIIYYRDASFASNTT